VFFVSRRRRHTRCYRDWSSDVCSSDLARRYGYAEATAAIMDVVGRLNRTDGLTVLLVTHQVGMLRGLASAVVWVQDGRAVRGRIAEMLPPERIAGVLGASSPLG